MSNDFEWKDGEEDVVFPSVQGVAVYRNPQGSVVIRQQAGPLEEEDTFILVPQVHVAALIEALQNVLEA